MSAKISASRRAAFLKALAETGNQTLAAERAKVSRSWVLLHRARDPDFDAAVRAAAARARAALTAPLPARPRIGAESASPLKGRGRNRPPSGWGHLDGVELVVRGTGGSGGGKRVQIARARLHQWDARVEDRFLQALSATCNVKAACAAAGMSAASAYNHRKRWAAFAGRWDAAEAEGFMRIEMALLEAAANPFATAELPERAPLPAMTAAAAIQLLHMHKHRVKGIGRAPGKSWRPPPSLEDPAIRASILRKFEAIERLRRGELSAEQRAADRAEWARRRGRADPAG